MAGPSENPPLCERIGREKFEEVIESFYEKLFDDPVLGKYFRGISDLESHKQRFRAFWWIGLGGEDTRPPAIDMVGKHEGLGLGANEFNRWAGLFAETLHQALEAPLAEAWIRMAQGIIRRLRSIP